MQAVILAAGVGSRLGQQNDNKPKCLLDIGGKPLIMHQLEALADNGVGPILMMVGFQEEAVRKAVGSRVEYMTNERYRETNRLYSLYLGRKWIQGPFILLNADLLIHPDIFRRLLEEPGNALAYDSTSTRGREQTKVLLRERRVIDLGKDVPPTTAQGESLGLVKFDAEGAKAFLAQTRALVEGGSKKAFVTEAVRATSSQMVAVHGVNMAGLPWVEVDFPYDLEVARKEVWPAIWGGRWKKLVLWRRTRWAAMFLVAAALTFAGWYASSQVGPGTVDWENVIPDDARRVALARTEKSPQDWWRLDGGDSVSTEVEAASLRLEFRALLPEASSKECRVIVEITIDGQAFDWAAFTGTPDPKVKLEGFTVADRDRREIQPPAGPHNLKLHILAGTCRQVLFRIRRPE